MKEVNIVYDARQGKTLEFEDETGKVWMSNTRDNSMPNVFFGDCSDPRPDDGVIVLEPIVTTPSHYNLNYLSKFRKVFGWASKFFETSPLKDKFVEVNCGSELCGSNVTSIKLDWPAWEDRINGVVIVSCNKQSSHQASIYQLREMLADMFQANGFQVDWYGHSGPRKSYYRGRSAEKLGVIARYKFHICTENTYDPVFSHNYLTEKLMHGMYCGSVPLYMGAYNIDDLISPKSYFDLRNFAIKKQNEPVVLLREPLLEAIKTFSKERFEAMQSEMRKCLADPGGIFYHTSVARTYKTILDNI